MYFVTVAASAMIVMAAAFIMNAVLNEGWLSHEHEGQAEASKGPELGVHKHVAMKQRSNEK
jgi:hypothetical protein